MTRLLGHIRWLWRSSMVRLSLLLSGIFALGMAVAVFVALTVGQGAIERRIDTTLAALAATSDLSQATSDTRAMILRAPENLRGLPRPFGRAVAQGGGTVALDRNFLNADIWRVLVATDSTGNPVMVAVPLEESEETRELLAGILWTTAAVVIVLALALGLGTGLLAQRRLRRINHTLGQLAAGDLTARTGHARNRDDLDDIARQLDVTAGALERLVTQTRHLGASIAHDLRTPLARLRAQLEMLPEDDARGAALEEAGKLAAIFDTIMRVARIEAAQGSDGFEPVSLADLAAELAEVFGPVIEDGGKTLTLDVGPAATVQADRQMLMQAMANLIQNALVHGGDAITLHARGLRLGLSDNGPGVPPEAYAEIVKPMVRLDAARSTEGSGLGLALVRAVAERHGARLDLGAANPTGLRVTLDFADL
ncbi:ATP-binding protein [Yoonia sp. R2331]|uniref:sensor histidine kinase n=1 Tax=Yoonia sp. R2331 TaxID=3237238 RepID=UPI0034E5E7ED